MLVVDWSSNNHPNNIPLDVVALVHQGVQGIIVKLNEWDYVNPFAHDDYVASEAAGLACLGLYDFARPDLGSGAQEAQHFLTALNSIGGQRPGTRFALDVEEHERDGPQIDPTAPLAAYCLDWASVIWPTQSRQDTRLKPFLYSRRTYLEAHGLVNDPQLDATFDLWLVDDGDVTPPGWSKVWLTQSYNAAWGYDQDVFNGIAYDWLSRAWGYQTAPINLVQEGQPDVDKSADFPTILRATADNLQRATADVALARTKFGLVT